MWRTENTPGSLASVPVPEGWQAQYNHQTDSLVMVQPGQSEVYVSVYAPIDPIMLLRSMLSEMGGYQYVDQVKPINFAGIEGASVQIEAQTRDWLMVLRHDSLLLLIRGKSVGSFEDLAPVLEVIARDTRAAPATWPPIVVGRYQTSASSSVNIRDGLYAEDYYTLHPNGLMESSTFIGGDVGGTPVFDKSREVGPHWEVRGNRLLIFDGQNGFTNFLVKAFNNGLELHDQNNNRVMAVRQ